MKIQSMFQKDIDRDINGVVQVSQDDQRSVKQELDEYIITKELRRHFATFIDNYVKAIDYPTGKIGVWISGFFGSGKSHFLKMLSYLLSNKEVDGKHAIDYFTDKFDDPMMYADAARCSSMPTETILFDILKQAPVNKDETAILRVFAKMFYRHCGFYGDDLKVARLERFIEKQGKTEAFRAAFESVHGAPWVDDRDAFAFFEDDLVTVLQDVLGMSEQAARNWFNGEETNELSVAQLVDDIVAYVDTKPNNFRLLFMVDEVGFFIGDNSDLMGNLQAIVEEIGRRCSGKVWVMVTSQEAIDSVVKVSGDDFSKIQGRFNTRLSLSSSSVDEVIKKRVLAKTEDADLLLQMEYDKEASGLKSLFAFDNPILDIKGFTSAAEFSATFPFVPYQFIIIQKVLAEIRKHGNSGKHLSGGERSMLSGFQEAAQKIENKDENALVPFYQFYDTVHTFLESTIRRVIDRCQNAADAHDGLEQQDVNVLKLLYLVRYIEDVKANIENIAILMIDDIHTDKIALRASITASLERLLTQNYISRNGDTYVDETLNGASAGGMRLRIVTVASDLYGVDTQRLILESQVNNAAIVVLSADTPYFDELEQAMKIRKYVKQRNVSQMPESIQRIIRDRNDEARKLESHARAFIEKAIVEGKFYVHGEILDLKSGSAKEKLDEAMKNLVESVYSKLNMVKQFVDSDAGILEILNSTHEEFGFTGTGANNEDALNEISQWLELQNQKMLTTSMGDVQRRYQAIPYGWKEIDIAALIARLIVQQKIQINYGGAVVGKEERRLVDFLRKKTEIDRAIVVRRIAPSEELIRKSINFLRDYLGAMDIPSDEDGLIRFVLSTFETKRSHYQKLLDDFYTKESYPEKETVTAARDLMNDVLSQRKDNVALLKWMLQKQDDLLDSAEDMGDVEMFFKTQWTVFANAKNRLANILKEKDYFATDIDTLNFINTMSTILAMPKPYSRIGELPELGQKVKNAYDGLLDMKREEVVENIRQCMQDVHQLASEAWDAGKLLHQADDYFVCKREAAKVSTSLTELDAMITQLLSYKDAICRRMEVMSVSHQQEALNPTPATPAPKPPKIMTVRRYDLCSVKRLQSKEDIDKYVEAIREKLMKTLESCDGVQIN